MRNFNKSQIIQSLNFYLTETESQYNDCFGKACEQGALLELQRDAISTLQKRINILECDEFLNTFMLHFIYCILLFKSKEDLESKTKQIINMEVKICELSNRNQHLEKERDSFQCKCQEANEEIKKLRSDLEDSHKKLELKKQCKMDKLLFENNDLKQQLQVYKLDFNLIKEEIKMMQSRMKGYEDLNYSKKIPMEEVSEKNEWLKYPSSELIHVSQKCKKLKCGFISKMQPSTDDLKMRMDSKLYKYQKGEIIEKLTKEPVEAHEKLSKPASYESNCQREKGEMKFTEKNQNISQPVFQKLKEMGDYISFTLKLLEDNNNKYITEVEDIGAQAEDMQHCLRKLKTECDETSKSLNCMSTDLAKMKKSMSEMSQDTNNMIKCMHNCINEQDQIIKSLLDK